MGNPLSLPRRFRLIPPEGGINRVGEGEVPLYLARGAAFGSGEHETTRSMLEHLEAMGGLDGMTVFDLGCGTGILAVAAALLGAEKVTAVDVDPPAVATAKETSRLNGVEARVDVREGSLDKNGPSVDLLLANLYGDLLLEMASTIVARLKPGGTLILSGVGFDHLFDIKRAYSALGCVVLSLSVMEEYSTLRMVRAGSGSTE